MLRELLLIALVAFLGACAIVERPTPIPVRPLTVKADCSYRDETGGSGLLRLDVAAARVRAFEAKANFPQHGSCHFELKDFRQTREMPAIELSQPNGSCIVRMWEQGTRVTVAFQQCEKMCSGSAWDQLLPMIYDRRDGTCA
ncbi:MAG: hypothetical protein LC123_15750 [Burkholderiales bacterium]|jgi:hypothetical protein|uniref:Lipoprotein n=1 Tax=Candidatus Desulfobacillus denitrificans TaxID=2608985 RepID=A0A809R3Q1_9PROT|nr:hypothetical protein [Rhodocyclaceae bacterium]MCZ2421279.1 hypothetical protein [Burkholderiales bacterium]OQY72432.1 MAG: hypothetical protein B6D47_05035 [Rhodocyclaceae bacterium UTPRO2]BBO22220.1 conserved hypothetical protein [Candidatus Desulfobacillus denitrificans]MBV6410304.1 hypothetical protein [Rhodocyclaceae bacterium]